MYVSMRVCIFHFLSVSFTVGFIFQPQPYNFLPGVFYCNNLSNAYARIYVYITEVIDPSLIKLQLITLSLFIH